MYECHMKITLNIDDALLARVMASTGATTKTDAIHLALSEMDRRAKLTALLANDDFGMSAEDWRNAFDENSLVDDDGSHSARVAEQPPKPRKANDRKPRPRR